MIKIAINGFGRIGRNVVRALYENGYADKVTVVAINDLAPVESSAHMLSYDSAHGRFNAQVQHDGSSISVNGNTIPMFSNRDPSQLPWAELDVDIVFECTGFFRSKEKASLHLQAGAKKFWYQRQASN